jgi:hypothetical protein
VGRIVKTSVAALLVTVSLTQAAAARDKAAAKAPVPAIFQNVVDCLQIDDSAQRLTCYDQNVQAMKAAQKSDQLFIASEDQIKESRRGLFGLTLPSLKIFGGADGDYAEVKEIEGVIASVRETAAGYIFTLADGAVWAQSENRYLGMTPKKGQKIVIRKAALGSYMGKLEGGVGFRIKRLNN